PVGAMLAKSALSPAFSYGSHGSTFGGNKLAMSASSAVLDVMIAPGFLEQAWENGNYLQDQLKKALGDNPKVSDIRGLGYMIGIQTTENLADLVQAARDQGLIVLTAGSDVIRLLPPLTLSKEEIDQGVAILSQVFA
ncbi:aminotransferase class III-fold pyridoxal phosphate-dependent enzyme, partial [Streptococcus sobrinus]